MALSDCQHHLSEDQEIPMAAGRYMYLPMGKRNVVRREDSLSNASWKYPWNLEPAGIDWTIS